MDAANQINKEDVEKLSNLELRKALENYTDNSGINSAGGYFYQYVCFLIAIFTYRASPSAKFHYEYVDDITIYEDGDGGFSYSIQTKTYALFLAKQAEVYKNWIWCPFAQNYVLVTGHPSQMPEIERLCDAILDIIHKEAFKEDAFDEKSKTKSADIVRASREQNLELREYILTRLSVIFQRVEYKTLAYDKAVEQAKRGYYALYSGETLENNADVPPVWARRFEELDRRLMQKVYLTVLIEHGPFIFTRSELSKLHAELLDKYPENGPYTKLFKKEDYTENASFLAAKSPKHVQDLEKLFGHKSNVVARYVMFELYYKEVRDFITMRETDESNEELVHLEQTVFDSYDTFYSIRPKDAGNFYQLVHNSQISSSVFNADTRNEGIPGCFIFLSDLDEDNYVGDHIKWL